MGVRSGLAGRLRGQFDREQALPAFEAASRLHLCAFERLCLPLPLLTISPRTTFHIGIVTARQFHVNYVIDVTKRQLTRHY